MSFMDKLGLSALADRIQARFPFREEAVGSASASSSNGDLTLVAVSGGTLDTVSGLAGDSEAAKTFNWSNGILTVTAADGSTQLAHIDIKALIQSEIRSSTSGFMTQSAADARYGHALGLGSGKKLILYDGNADVLSDVTLP